MKNFEFLKLFILALVISASLISAQADAAVKAEVTKKPYSFLRLFYYRDRPAARTSLFKNWDSIDVLAPQSYSIGSDGILAGKIDPVITNFANKHKIKLMPLITNRNFSRDAANAVFDDEVKQDLAISALIAEGKKQNYWGWQMDYEGMTPEYKDKYSAFIKKMGAAMKENNFVFSVAVMAQISSNPDDYPRDLWNRIIGAYDYAALASSSDFISIMTYDDPFSTGPVSPYPWLEKVMEYALQYIPPEKLSLGIPLYYWHWNDTTGKKISVGGHEKMMDLIKKRKVNYGYSETEKTSFLEYNFKKNHYTLWYENAKSIKPKIELMKKHKLHGFSAWVLGFETPSVHNVF